MTPERLLSPRPAPGPLRAGSVPYLNAAPLVRGLEHRITLRPPSELAVALRRGELDAALLSVTEVLLRSDYAILDGPCVASRDEVYSVFLAHRRPLAEIDRVHCHQVSLTSVNLLRVLLAARGLHPTFLPLPDPAAAPDLDFALLIGDPAIAFRRQGTGTHTIWDLGRAWRDLTGWPFVYAVWALRRSADTTALRRELRLAADRGRCDLEAVIREWPAFDEPFRRLYLTRHTHHTLGPEEKSGVAEFVRRLRDVHDGPVRDPVYISD